MQKIFTILLILSSSFTSAQIQKIATRSAIGYTIRGELDGAANAKVYLKRANFYKDENVIDSTIADHNGRFGFKGSVREATPYVIFIKGKPRGRMFILENSTIHIKGKANAIAEAKLTGSKEEEIYRKFTLIIEDLYALEDSYAEANEKKDTTAIRNITSKRDRLIKQAKDFITTYPSSFASVGFLGYFVNSDRIAEADSLLQGFKQAFKNSTEQLDYFEKLITTRINLTTGSIAPDFSQPDTAGNIVSLPSFRGVFVLLDFWASWCLPCRKENINLVNVYKEFGSKKFSIVSISLDSDKDAWLKAIRKDGLSWTQVSDLKGLFNKAGELYAVLGIPDNYLIDPDGKIIGRQLHGEELQKRLEDVLK